MYSEPSASACQHPPSPPTPIPCIQPGRHPASQAGAQLQPRIRWQMGLGFPRRCVPGDQEQSRDIQCSPSNVLYCGSLTCVQSLWSFRGSGFGSGWSAVHHVHSALVSLPILLPLLQGLDEELLLLHPDQTSLQRESKWRSSDSWGTDRRESSKKGPLRDTVSFWGILTARGHRQGVLICSDSTWRDLEGVTLVTRKKRR